MATTHKKRKAPRPPSINPATTGVAPAPGALTPDDIRRSANAMVQLQTRPQLNAIDNQMRQTQTQGAGISDRITQLYKNLGQSYGDQLGKFDAGAKASAAAMQGIGQARQDAITAGYGQATDRLAADGAVRGPGLDGGTSKALASQMGEAHANAAADSSFSTTAQKQASDAQRGLIESMANVMPMRGVEAAGAAGQETAKALGGLADKRTDVIGQGDALRVKTINDLSQQAFTNYATVQGLNLKGDAQAIQLALGTANNQLGYDRLGETVGHNTVTEDQGDSRVAQGAERNKIAWSNHNLSEDKFTYQKRLVKQLDANGGKPLTAWQRLQVQKANTAVRSSIEGVGDVGDAMHQAMVKGDDGKMHHYTNEQIRSALLKKYKNDADVVDAGIQVAHNQPLSADIISRLKARHIGVPKKWQKGNPNLRDTSSNAPGAGK